MGAELGESMGRSGSRRKINLGGEWEVEKETLPAQEIDKQLNNYEESVAKETDRARQLRIDELSLQQERNPTTESRLLTQIQDLQNKVNSLSDAREFCDPETASTRTMPCRDSVLPHDTRILWVLLETFLKTYLLEKGHPLGFIFLWTQTRRRDQQYQVHFSSRYCDLEPFVSSWRN